MNIETRNFRPADELLALGSDPVPAKAYYDPAYFELEREAVFKNTWLQIGHICEVADTGSFIRRELEFAKVSLIIMRGKDGVIRAFHNTCPHRGTQLVSASEGKQSKISCIYHMWTFGNEGQLITAPDFERFNLEKKDCGLKQVALEVCAGLIFINLATQPEQNLRECLGELAEQLEQLPVARATTFSEYIYEIDANWKLTYDNFQENYHIRFIHPKSSGPGTGPENPFGYPNIQKLYGPHRTQQIWVNPDAAAMTKPVQGMAIGRGYPRGARDGLLGSPLARDYFALFPNFFLLGSPLNHFSHTVYPLAAGKSRGVIRLYWVGDDESASVRFAREYTTATTRDVHSEDVTVIEAGQRGLNGGALEFIHFQEQEALCRHLYLMVDARVQALKTKQAEAEA